jgi:hypothetical protein
VNAYKDRTASRSGLTIVEVLVSIAVLALVMATSLTLYDGARRAFKKGENQIEQQQVVRIAYDKLVSDLRMAGFNHNPDGVANRPDEQIEGAFDTAIVFRADLDAESAEATTPEEDLATAGIFDAVSTGNDEIVTYVLAGANSAEILEYWADVAGQTRDGAVEQVRIQDVALTQDSPPYTLYRVTLDVDGAAVKHPLADNIRSMTFTYYDKSGNILAAAGGLDVGLDVANRSRIRKIGIEIEGLTRDPRPRWSDPDDDNPVTRSMTKFKLEGDVTPRNLGMIGMLDLAADLTPPSQLAAPTLIAGHCEGLYVYWTPNSALEQVDHYRLLYGTSPNPSQLSQPTGVPSLFLQGLTALDGINPASYYVQVQAVDNDGNASTPSPEASLAPVEASIPHQPVNLDISGGTSARVAGRIELRWDQVIENVDGAVPRDPQSPLIRDLSAYRLYRGILPDALLDESDFIATTTELAFVDINVQACKDYYYLVKAVDRCDVMSEAFGLAVGQADSAAQPTPPVNIEAFTESLGFRISWSEVNVDIDGAPIDIDTYDIYRVFVPNGTEPASGDSYTFVDEVTIADGDPPDYLDSPAIPGGHTVFYNVTAEDGCGLESDPSLSVQPFSCDFDGYTFIENIAEGDVLGPDLEGIRITVEDILVGYWATGRYPTDPRWESVTVEITDDLGINYSYSYLDDPADWWSQGIHPIWRLVEWVPVPGTAYTIKASVVQNGCTSSYTVHTGS